MSGARLGIYQGNALGCPVVAAAAFAMDSPLLAGLMLVGAVVGWLGWNRDYGLRWTP